MVSSSVMSSQQLFEVKHCTVPLLVAGVGHVRVLTELTR